MNNPQHKKHLKMIKHRKYNLRESLRRDDLRDLVSELIEIDRYKPKLGPEENTVVICFKTDSADAASDLGGFLEWSSAGIEDVEVSDASDKDGKFHVYIEIKRLPGLAQKILDIVKDIDNITGSLQWKFAGMNGKRLDLTLGNLSSTIVQDPKLYLLPAESRDYYMRMKNLTKY